MYGAQTVALNCLQSFNFIYKDFMLRPLKIVRKIVFFRSKTVFICAEKGGSKEDLDQHRCLLRHGFKSI